MTCLEQLEELHGIRARLESQAVDDADQPFWLMTVRGGELAARARVAWAHETLVALREPSS